MRLGLWAMRVLLLGVVAAAGLLATASASAESVETRMPFSELITNPCTGEEFLAEGFVQMTAATTFSTSGGFHDRFHVNTKGMTAKSLVTGVKYVVQQEWNVGTNAHDEQSTIRHILKERYVRAGEDGTLVEDDDFYAYFHLHITVNAQGTPTSFKMESQELVDDTCQ